MDLKHVGLQIVLQVVDEEGHVRAKPPQRHEQRALPTREREGPSTLDQSEGTALKGSRAGQVRGQR